MLPGLRLVGMMLIAAPAVSCGTSPTVAPPPLTATSTGAAFESESCSAFRPPTEPDLMGWDSGSRANLRTKREQGVVAVRYRAEGCNVELEVLNCIGDGKYTFDPYSASDTKVSNSTRDLYADLPLGAARLGSKVGGGRALRTDYMMTGVYRLSSYEAFPTSKLRGTGCDEATHVVSQMYVGGFGMASGATETLEAGASAFGLRVGGAQERTAERVAQEGVPEACERAQKEGKSEPLCSVPLRVGLVPIEGRSKAACPGGSIWDGTGCAQKQIECPAGTTMVNGVCAAQVATDCPPGMDFAPGRGCTPVLNQECPPGMAFAVGRGCTAVPQAAEIANVPGTGRLNVNSIPVSRVYIDGSLIGETPLSGIELPSGVHLIRFVHPRLGERTIEAHVVAGRTVNASNNAWSTHRAPPAQSEDSDLTPPYR